MYYLVSDHPFVYYDDNVYVTDNAHVKSGLSWETLKWAFTTSEAGNWHPLTWLSHALDYQLFDADPAGHHNINLLLHVLNVLLLFGVLRQATGFTGRSWVVAALFALHPINVESVVWIAERKNLLSMLFFLLALGAYRWYVRDARTIRYLVVGALFVLGLMAKPQVITFPFVLLLWDYWPLRRMAVAGELKAPDTPAGSTVPQQSFSWLVGEKLHPPTLQLDKEQHVVGNQPFERKHFHREEIRSYQNIHMGADEIFPAGRVFSFGGRRDSVSAQDITHRLVR